jgi:hypothetical protein
MILPMQSYRGLLLILKKVKVELGRLELPAF